MECNFCQEIFRKNREQGLPEEGSIVYQDDNIYVMPDISPLIVGHLLIVSKRHCHGFASADEETIQSLKKFLRFYRQRIKNRNFTVCEHGAVLPNYAGASIDHAHMHIFPFDIKLKEKITSEYGEPQLYKLEEIRTLGIRKQSYFWCMCGRDESIGWIYEVEAVPSQILRKHVNDLLNKKDNYNWKSQYSKASSHINFYKTLAWWDSLTLIDTFKWKKKLLLEKYGFISYKNILDEITRFQYEDKDKASVLLSKELELEKKERCTHRVILVSKKHQYSLPNYIVQKEEDLYGLEEFYGANPWFSEVWCLTNRPPGKEIFSGRMFVVRQEEFKEMIIEIISGDDLRKLDRYSLGNDDLGYFRARKIMNNTLFEIEENRMQDFEHEVMHVFEYVKKELAIYSSNIKYFFEQVEQCGTHILSMDFRVEGKNIIFIDWDTAIDEKILNYEIE